MNEGPMPEDLSSRLGDAVNRYGKGQYLVLLVNITRENCGILQGQHMGKSQLYIGSPSGVVLCVDQAASRQLSGRLYHAYSREA